MLPFFLAPPANAQCPDKKLLENTLSAWDRDPLPAPAEQGLSIFTPFLDQMQACPYKNDSTHVRLIKKIGFLLRRENQYLEAVNYYLAAIHMATTNPDKKAEKETDLPGSYYWLSVCFDSLKLVDNRMAALDSCYTIASRIGHLDPSVTAALYARGEHAFDIGDYHDCIDYMSRCEWAAKQPGIYASYMLPWAGSSLLWRVKALLQLQEYREADRLLHDRIDECTRSGALDNLGTIYSQLAELQIQKRDFGKALFFYNKSLENDRHFGYNFNCKQTLKDIGFEIYALQRSDFRRAQAFYFEALRVVNKDPSLKQKDVAESLDIYRLIGNSFVMMRQFDSAARYFQLAYEQISPGSSARNILNTPEAKLAEFKKIYYITTLVVDEADSYRSQFEATGSRIALDRAIQIYKIADQLLDRVKLQQFDFDSKLFWRRDSRRLYEHALQACYENNNSLEAFYFFEKSKAVLLNDELTRRRWVRGDDIVKETQLEKRTRQIQKELLIKDSGSEQYSKLQNELFNGKQELRRLQDVIKSSNPLYYQNFLDKSNFISLEDVRRSILNNHEALVELFNGDSAVYMLVITRDQSHLEMIDKARFDNLSTAFTAYISHPDLLNRGFDHFTDLSQQLYQLLFQKVNLSAGRIIISPDGKYFPFEALVTKLQPLTYFLDDHAVSYTYSARYLLNSFGVTASQPEGIFIGVAPLNFANLPELTGSDKSLRRVRNYFADATSYVGPNASKNNFLGEFYKYKVVQLYTHATESGSLGEPMIFFSDSALSLSDLLPERKPATDLIVLSACQTASGKLYTGEGVFSFNRSFAAMGIPSSVSNIWPVSNEATYRLTELFYKYLSRGEPLDVALQHAKKEFRETATLGEERLPYYWAAAVLVGKTDEISFRGGTHWGLVAGIALIASMLLSGWVIRRTKVLPKTTTDRLAFE